MDKEEVDARIAEITKVEQAIGHPRIRHQVDAVIDLLTEMFDYLDKAGIPQESITLVVPVIGFEEPLDMFEVKRLARRAT